MLVGKFMLRMKIPQTSQNQIGEQPHLFTISLTLTTHEPGSVLTLRSRIEFMPGRKDTSNRGLWQDGIICQAWMKNTL